MAAAGSSNSSSGNTLGLLRPTAPHPLRAHALLPLVALLLVGVAGGVLAVPSLVPEPTLFYRSIPVLVFY